MIAYKGFDKNLQCRKEQFVVGQTYTKPEKEKPRLCSDDGYHYCKELTQVFKHYSNDGSNRFCEIEVLGNFTDDNDKSITTSFKILRELSSEEINKGIYESNLNLDLVKEIQKKFPMFHVGGSVGLFLHGVRLKRWRDNSSSDIDMVSPYFVLPEGSINLDGDENDKGDEIVYLDAKASGNDFDETFMIGSIKVDYKIDPKQRYEIIEYDGFKFKVSPLITILDAKMKYALNGQQKHVEDMREMTTGKRK